MKLLQITTLSAIAAFTIDDAQSQQSVIVPWDQTWEFMHPMGALPDVPVGGDADFDTTWLLPATDFAAQYDGPAFGSVPALVGDPAVTDSFDSGVSQGPIGYGSINYFGDGGAEFVDFGDDDGDAGNGLGGELSTPESGSRRAAYFRTTFTIPPDNGPLVRPVLLELIDDGAYIYIDGELVAAINMRDTTPANLDTYATVNATSATATEEELRLIELSLPAGSSTGSAPADATLAENARIVTQLLSLDVGEHTLAISARSNSQNSSDVVMALELSAEPGCIISAEASSAVRSDAGTPTNPADDTFTFEVIATGVGGGASWSSSPGGGTGAYDTPVTLGPFPVAQSPVTVTLTAASAATCTTEVMATSPSASVSAEASSFARDLRGTIDPSDDTFTVMVDVSAQFASATWTTTSTSPSQAIPGTPTSGSYGTPLLFGPYPISAGTITIDFADGTDPSLVAQVTLAAPIFIGGRSFGGVPTNLLSDGPVPPQWVSDGATAPTFTMNNAGGDEWREIRSELLDLSGAGPVGFSAQFVARETSTGSNFEGIDAFRAKLVLTGPGVPAEIDLIAAFDRDSDGMLSGTDSAPYDAALDEFNLDQQPESTALNNTIPLAALIPAEAVSAQLVVEAKGISGSEFFDVSQISFNDGCTFDLATANVFRNSNGQPTMPLAHTLEFELLATPRGLVSPFGWNVSFTRGGASVPGATITGGAYNTSVSVAGLAAEGGPITVTVSDRIDSNCRRTLLLEVPVPPSIVATTELGGPEAKVFSDGAANGWSAIAGGLEMSQTPLSEFTTEFVDLSAVSRTVFFSMNLQARETSTSSNFETADTFAAELLLDDGASITVVDLVTPHDTNGNGQMNANEFNPDDEPNSARLDNTFAFSAVIPANTTRVALRILASVDAGSEFLRLTNALFTITPPDGSNLDSDGDGASDADEAIAGTDPNDPTSVFRVTSVASTVGFPTVAGRFYQAYLSTDLVTWTRDDSTAALAGDGNPAAWPLDAVAGQPERQLRMAVALDNADFPPVLP